MIIDDLKPTGKNTFEIVSGRLLVADPFNLGYPKYIEDRVKEISVSAMHENPIVTFPYGVLYYTLTRGGYGTDCIVGVYREGNTIRLVRNDNLLNMEDIEAEFEGFREDYTDFDSFRQEYVDSDQRVVDTQSYHKLRQPIFDASVDLCCLLIGDAEKYSLSESDWRFADNPYVPPERKALYEESRRELTRETYRKQILQIPNGLYTADHLLQEETLVLRSLKK